MIDKTIISVSILSMDLFNIERELKRFEDSPIDFLHFDVMDGHFVNNLSFGAPLLKSISNKTGLVKDVHLMISNPKKYYMDFIKAGADIITFHYEALKNDDEVFELIDLIKKENVRVGISIKPKTKVEKILKFLDKIDLVLVMSVEPGFGGQEFMNSALIKIKEIKNAAKPKLLISVDGGINEVTGKKCIEAGTNILVSGSYLVKSNNLEDSLNKLCR